MTIPKGRAAILSIYIDDGERLDHRPLHEVILDLLIQRGIAGATLFKGVSGYGSDGVRHTSTILRLMENMPLKIEVVDQEEKLREVVKELEQIIAKGLVVLSPAEVMISKFEPHA